MAPASTIVLSVGCTLYMGTAVVAADSAANPYLTLGLAGVLLGSIVVPAFRWQQKQIERLMTALEATVESQRLHHDSEDKSHTKIISGLATTEELLRQQREDHARVLAILTEQEARARRQEGDKQP